MGKPDTVFRKSFLETFHERDESAGSCAAMLSGRWKIVEREGGVHGYGFFEVFREWEDELTEQPYATFQFRDHALLLAAIAPIFDQPPIYEAGEGTNQVPLYCEGRMVGEFKWAPDELVDILNVAAHLVRSPSALALLLEAAGPSTIDAVGRLLHQRTMRQEGNET